MAPLLTFLQLSSFTPLSVPGCWGSGLYYREVVRGMGGSRMWGQGHCLLCGIIVLCVPTAEKTNRKAHLISHHALWPQTAAQLTHQCRILRSVVTQLELSNWKVKVFSPLISRVMFLQYPLQFSILKRPLKTVAKYSSHPWNCFCNNQWKQEKM